MTFLRTADLTPDSGRRFMTDVYRRLAFEPAHLDLFARYFRALGDADGPVLIHCAAGKDRTGLLAALTHHLLGVHPDDIVADYLLTNTHYQMPERTPVALSQDVLNVLWRVQAGFLGAAFDAVDTEFGGVDLYLKNQLGLDPSRLQRLRELYLQK